MSRGPSGANSHLPCPCEYDVSASAAALVILAKVRARAWPPSGTQLHTDGALVLTCQLTPRAQSREGALGPQKSSLRTTCLGPRKQSQLRTSHCGDRGGGAGAKVHPDWGCQKQWLLCEMLQVVRICPLSHRSLWAPCQARPGVSCPCRSGRGQPPPRLFHTSDGEGWGRGEKPLKCSQSGVCVPLLLSRTPALSSLFFLFFFFFF